MSGLATPLPVFRDRPANQAAVRHTGVGLGLFLAAHVPLALLMYRYSEVATLHAACTATVGLYWAISGRQRERVAYAGAYIAGAEVLWRMTNAVPFWEFSKYLTSALFLIALVRVGHVKRYVAPLFYFLLLLPSIPMTFANQDPEAARRLLAFNLSGPLALTMSASFFLTLRMSAARLPRLFLSLLGPIAGIAAITVVATPSPGSVILTARSSSFATSGGFGPNQVSSILGLGAFLAFYYLLHEKSTRGQIGILVVCLVAFASQSALTFSRGGLYAATGAAAAASIYLVRTRARARLTYLLLLLFAAANLILFPQLEKLTQGALGERFRNTSLTGREELFVADLRIWGENAVFGVGPGMGRLERGRPAHTEFSRLLSEHGILGLFALFLLVYMAARGFQRARTPREKALVVSFMCWSMLYMLVNAMRAVMPAYLFGLALVKVVYPRRPIYRLRLAGPAVSCAGARPAEHL